MTCLLDDATIILVQLRGKVVCCIMKRTLATFLTFWVVLFALSFITASPDLPLMYRLGGTGVLAAFAGLLSINGKTNNRSNRSKQKQKTLEYSVHYPLNPKVLYRVRNGKIYKSSSSKPTYEIKKDKVYFVNDPKPVYQIRNDMVYRWMEPAPIFDIKGNTLYYHLSSKAAYEIKRIS